MPRSDALQAQAYVSQQALQHKSNNGMSSDTSQRSCESALAPTYGTHGGHPLHVSPDQPHGHDPPFDVGERSDHNVSEAGEESVASVADDDFVSLRSLETSGNLVGILSSPRNGRVQNPRWCWKVVVW